MAHLLLRLSYSIRQRIVLDTSAHSTGDADGTPAAALADVSIRQHTSAYVSIRQHTSAYVSIRQQMLMAHLLLR